MSLGIDSSLNYYFYGVRYTKKLGLYHSKISQGFWDTLNLYFEAVNYKHLTISHEDVVDDPVYECVIYFEHDSVNIFAHSENIPDNVKGLFYWLGKTYENEDLKPMSNDSCIELSTRMKQSLRIVVPPPPILQFRKHFRRPRPKEIQ